MIAKVKAESTTEILLYDPIGSDYYSGISAKDMANVLKEVDTPNILLRINSPGGDVFDGFAMYEMLVKHKAKVSVAIEGLAASAASVVAMAGESIEIAQAGFVMIHNPWTFAYGDSINMRKVADLLEKIGKQIANVYQMRTEQTSEQLHKWMDEETWFSSEEAKKYGFADNISKATQNSAVLNSQAKTVLAKFCKQVPQKVSLSLTNAETEYRRKRLEQLAPKA